MGELMVFNNVEFGEVRSIEIEGKVYFVGKDVAKALGYSNPSKAVSTHCKHTRKEVINVSSQNGNSHSKARNTQEMSLIDEGDVYRLIIRSKLESAEKFEVWVFDEVLPSIRKNGGYILTDDTMTDDEIMARALLVAQRTIENKNKQIEELTPKALAWEEFLDREGLITVGDFSKCLAIKNLGRNNMYGYMRNKKILMPNNIPYQKYITLGHFVIKPNGYHKKGDEIIEDFKTMITKKGIDYLIKKLKEDGYIVDKR